MKDNVDDIKYYPQVLLEQCVYKCFFNNILDHVDLEFTDLNQILSQMIVTNLKKRLMRILCLMNKNNIVIIIIIIMIIIIKAQ